VATLILVICSRNRVPGPGSLSSSKSTDETEECIFPVFASAYVMFLTSLYLLRSLLFLLTDVYTFDIAHTDTRDVLYENTQLCEKDLVIA